MRRFLHPFFAFSAILLLGACIPPQVHQHGYVDNFNRLKEIQVGVTDREAVREKIGSPSLVNDFGEETWYYVQERKESVAFLAPEVTDQNVTSITFDAQGVVSNIKGYGIKDSTQVAIAEEITPTEGQQLGFFEQILGNVGRFNTQDANAAGRGAGRAGAGGGGMGGIGGMGR
jgi:outer membrane protein assembly factor BamE (lipoprotein component of BamABCDE complex)